VIWIVVAEALALLVLGVFVIALVHSYAGLVAKVEELAESAPRRPSRGPPARAAGQDPTLGAHETVDHVTGVTPTGDAVTISLVGAGRDTLLAFLTSTCTSCQHLWGALSDADGDVLPRPLRLVVVPKGPEQESPSSILAVAPVSCDVVMSSDAWSDFNVPGSPYFVHVDGTTGTVLGEGTALSWARVVDLASVATGDDRLAESLGADPRKPSRDRRQEAEVDRLLLDAGILPGDPSLYPTPALGHEGQ
jgi:hypothetical protein